MLRIVCKTNGVRKKNKNVYFVERYITVSIKVYYIMLLVADGNNLYSKEKLMKKKFKSLFVLCWFYVFWLPE